MITSVTWIRQIKKDYASRSLGSVRSRFRTGPSRLSGHILCSVRQLELSPVSIKTQSLAFLAVFVYATHATQAIAFEWKPGFRTTMRGLSLMLRILRCGEGLLYDEMDRSRKVTSQLLGVVCASCQYVSMIMHDLSRRAAIIMSYV